MIKEIELPKVFTVTCLRDFELFVLHCYSIKKFLNISEFNIIINETGKKLRKWKKRYDSRIACIFQNSCVINIIFKDDQLPLRQTGWVTQQVLKLSCLDDDPYIVLDSGTIFIRPTDVLQIKNFDKIHIDTLVHYVDFTRTCYKHFPVDYCRSAHVPHKINPEVCKKIFESFGGYEQFIDWFYTQHQPSEFILHDMAAQFFNMDFDDTGYDFNYNKLLLDPTTIDEYDLIFQKLSQNESIKIFTMHIGVLLDPAFAEYRDKLFHIVTSLEENIE
jgi:hypothetical protein